MATLAAIVAFITPFLKPVLVPLFTALVGWLVPSPLQKASKTIPEVRDAEAKADAGDPSGLDNP